MKIEIERSKNGCIFEFTDSFSGQKEKWTYQEASEGDRDIEMFADILYLINEHYGPQTGRYSPKRIYIDIRPGDKYESH